MTPTALADAVTAAISAAVAAGDLAVEVPGEIVLESPRNPEHGDFASSVALRLAKPAGKPLVDTFVTEVSQDTWILFPWDTEQQFVPPIAKSAVAK